MFSVKCINNLLLPTVRPPNLDGEVVADRDQNLGVHGIEGNRVDHVTVWVSLQTKTIVAVPQVAMFVFSTAETDLSSCI